MGVGGYVVLLCTYMLTCLHIQAHVRADVSDSMSVHLRGSEDLAIVRIIYHLPGKKKPLPRHRALQRCRNRYTAHMQLDSLKARLCVSYFSEQCAALTVKAHIHQDPKVTVLDLFHYASS